MDVPTLIVILGGSCLAIHLLFLALRPVQSRKLTCGRLFVSMLIAGTRFRILLSGSLKRIRQQFFWPRGLLLLNGFDFLYYSVVHLPQEDEIPHPKCRCVTFGNRSFVFGAVAWQSRKWNSYCSFRCCSVVVVRWLYRCRPLDLCTNYSHVSIIHALHINPPCVLGAVACPESQMNMILCVSMLSVCCIDVIRPFVCQLFTRLTYLHASHQFMVTEL